MSSQTANDMINTSDDKNSIHNKDKFDTDINTSDASSVVSEDTIIEAEQVSVEKVEEKKINYRKYFEKIKLVFNDIKINKCIIFILFILMIIHILFGCGIVLSIINKEDFMLIIVANSIVYAITTCGIMIFSVIYFIEKYFKSVNIENIEGFFAVLMAMSVPFFIGGLIASQIGSIMVTFRFGCIYLLPINIVYFIMAAVIEIILIIGCCMKGQ